MTGLAAILLAGIGWWVVQQRILPAPDPAVVKAETDGRIAEARAAQLRAESEARRLADEKSAAGAASRSKADAEAKRIATEKAKAEEAERQRVAAEVARRAFEEARRRDPILALAPGSGQSAPRPAGGR